MRLTNIYKALVKFHNTDHFGILNSKLEKILISITVKSKTLSQKKRKMDKLSTWKNNHKCIYIKLFLMHLLSGYFIVYVIEPICNNILILSLETLRFKLLFYISTNKIFLKDYEVLKYLYSNTSPIIYDSKSIW